MAASSDEHYFEGNEYFIPRLQVDDLAKKSRVESLLGSYCLTRRQVDRLRDQLATELRLGVQATPDPRPSIFPMVNTFVTKMPTGKEVGDFFGLDIGGTNLRITQLTLSQIGEDKFEQKLDTEFYDVPAEVRHGSGSVFFGFFATCIEQFLKKKGLDKLGKVLPLGFTFSFGFEQYAIDRGEIVQMGIATYVPEIFGKCPVQLLQQSIDSLKLPVKVVALANDSTATLVYSVYLDQDAAAGLILGSGTNIAYLEEVSRFGKITDPVATFGENPPKIFAVNSEFPLFGDDGAMDYAKCKYDHQLDEISLMPKSYTYEKITGGAYLGELLRLTLVDLVKNGVLLSGYDVTEQLAKASSIGSVSISLIEAEFEATGKKAARENREAVALFRQLGYTDDQISDDDCAILTFAAQLISIRSALFIASACSVFVDHINRPVVKIGCDGSLYKKHPKMARLINAYVKEFSPSKEASVFSADQGSSIGVALIAATVCCDEKK